MPKIKALILNWTGDRTNWGCQATSYGLEGDILEAAKGLDVQIDKVPLGEMTSADRRARAFFGRFLRSYLLDDHPGQTAKRLFERVVAHQYGVEAIDRLKNADIAIFMAEGTMTGDHFLRGIRLLELPQLAHDFGVPVISLNQTIFAKQESFMPVAAKVLNRLDAVAVREPASIAYAQLHGIQNVFLYPDSAFRTQPSSRPLAELLEPLPDHPLICVTSSASFSPAVVEGYLRTVLEFAKENNKQVCGLFWHADGYRHLSSLHGEVGGNPLVALKPPVDYRDVSQVLSKAHAFVGGRYHTAIQSACVGTPFIAMPAESHKTEGLLKLLEYPYPVVPFEDTEKLRVFLSQLSDRRDEVAHRLTEAVARVGELRQARLRWMHDAFNSVASGHGIPVPQPNPAPAP